MFPRGAALIKLLPHPLPLPPATPWVGGERGGSGSSRSLEEMGGILHIPRRVLPCYGPTSLSLPTSWMDRVLSD